MARRAETGGRLDRAQRVVSFAASRLLHRDEAKQAASYYARLRRYHETNDAAQHAWERSHWVADVAVPMTGAASLLEIGANTGRTLEILAARFPQMRLKGIDVNPRAIAAARHRGLRAELDVADVTDWVESADSWDAVLSISVLNWIPEAAAKRLARCIARSAHSVIAIELWDGEHAQRGVYKYSRNTMELFEQAGFETRHWQESPGQYDVRSPLWAYVGVRPEAGGRRQQASPGPR